MTLLPLQGPLLVRRISRRSETWELAFLFGGGRAVGRILGPNDNKVNTISEWMTNL